MLLCLPTRKTSILKVCSLTGELRAGNSANPDEDGSEVNTVFTTVLKQLSPKILLFIKL